MTRKRKIAAAFLLIMCVGASTLEARTTLCLSAPDGWRCRDVADDLRVTPSEAERTFTLTDAESRLIELGVVLPRETRIPARASSMRSVSLSIRQADADRWPDTVTVTLTDDALREWQFDLEGSGLGKSWRLRTQPGKYVVVARAPHHQAIHEEIRVGSKDLTISRVMERNPIISGTIRNQAGLPLPGSMVRAGDDLSTLSDESGSFSLEVPSEWPQRLEISYGGLATRVIDVPTVRRSFTFPPLTLTSAGTLLVRVEERNPNASDITAELIRPADDVVVKTAALTDVESAARFEGLEPGDYRVMLRGDHPLERLTRMARIKPGEETEAVMIVSPLELTIEVVRNGSPVAAALIEAINHDDGWNASLAADGRGKVVTKVWQQGKYLFAVRASADAAPFGTLESVEGDTETVVRLELPDRAIRGRVIDSGTGSAVADAAVRIESMASDRSGDASLQIKADPSGQFQFESLRAGTHSLTAIANAYLESAPLVVRLGENDRRVDVELKIERGRERSVRVLSKSGTPLSGASVIHAVDGVMQRIVRTSEQGEVRLPVPARSAPNVVYVVPREGSLAIFRLRGHAETDTIVVPSPVASLELRTTDTNGQPIPNIRFLIRVDGEIIPPDIQRHVELLRGDPMFTDASGTMTFVHLPSGFFEFWPLRTYGELQDIFATISESAPVQVAVKPGRNSATMTFDHKRP